MTDTLNLEDELHRKAGDAYGWLDNEFKRGAISANALYVSLMALDLALLGLAPQEYSEWALNQRQVYRSQAKSVERRVYTKGDVMVVLILDRDASEVRVTRIKGGIQTSKVTGFAGYDDDSRCALLEFTENNATLIGNGYTELL